MRRRNFGAGGVVLRAGVLLGLLIAGALGQAPAGLRGWTRGKGWGPVWGKEDEVGSLNAIDDAARLAALREVRSGKVYDLGVPYDRRSYKWPGHNPGEVITFRSPEGIDRQGDAAKDNPRKTYWHSCALFLSDNVGTQIDGLGHVTTGPDNHWYNGFTEAEAGGDFGIRRCDGVSIPPVIARGVLVDVAGQRGVEALPGGTAISPRDLEAALQWEKVDIQPGDVVLIRTGVLRHWGEAGADHELIAKHDSAGITLESARWLVEEKGAVLIGSDTSGLEVTPAPEGVNIPVHVYLLIEQGVHIGELHYLEDLARDRVYRLLYIALVNKVRGAVAGFTMRPVALPRGA